MKEVEDDEGQRNGWIREYVATYNNPDVALHGRAVA
jgi:hypothetical protein